MRRSKLFSLQLNCNRYFINIFRSVFRSILSGFLKNYLDIIFKGTPKAFLKNFSIKKACKALFGLFTFSWLFYSAMAFAEDDLSGVMESVKSDFGSGSTFIKLLYLAEIIACVYGYHKTKNVALLAGIVVVSLFLNFALGHWVFVS